MKKKKKNADIIFFFIHLIYNACLYVQRTGIAWGDRTWHKCSPAFSALSFNSRLGGERVSTALRQEKERQGPG